MLTIDLKSLKLQELTRLLESANAHGEDELARMVSAELLSRQGRRTASDLSTLSVRLDADPPPPPRATRAPSNVGRIAALAAGVAALGLATVWAFNVPQPAPPPTAAAAVAAAPQIPEAPRAAVLLTSLSAPEAAPPPPARQAAPSPAPTAHPAASSPPAGGNPCLTLALPGDRLVCGYPTLAARHRRLEAALERARIAGEDVAALEAAQATWTKSRDHTRDRHKLADLYDTRISELERAAAPDKDPPS